MLPVSLFHLCRPILSVFLSSYLPAPAPSFSPPNKRQCFFSLSVCLPLLLTLALSRGHASVSVSVSPPRKWLSFRPLLCQPAPATVLCRSERDNDITRTVLLYSFHPSIIHPSVYLPLDFFSPSHHSTVYQRFSDIMLLVSSHFISPSHLSSSLSFSHPPFSSFHLSICAGGVVSPPEEHSIVGTLTASLSGRELVHPLPPHHTLHHHPPLLLQS